MKKQKDLTPIIAIPIMAVGFIAFLGWVFNLVKIFNTGFDVITGEMIVRIIGVFLAHIGAVLGFF